MVVYICDIYLIEQSECANDRFQYLQSQYLSDLHIKNLFKSHHAQIISNNVNNN